MIQQLNDDSKLLLFSSLWILPHSEAGSTCIMRGLLTAPGLESAGLPVVQGSSRRSPGRGSMCSLTDGRGACAPGCLPAQGLGQARPTYPVGTESGPIPPHLLLWKVMLLDSLLPRGPSHPVLILSPRQGSALRANRLAGTQAGNRTPFSSAHR